MKKFIIEHVLPGKLLLTSDELSAIALRSCQVMESIGAPYHWVQTYITDSKLYSVHIADDLAAIEEHARQGGFPVNDIAEVRQIIDPTNCPKL